MEYSYQNIQLESSNKGKENKQLQFEKQNKSELLRVKNGTKKAKLF